jgi:hypothetical protein
VPIIGLAAKQAPAAKSQHAAVIRIVFIFMVPIKTGFSFAVNDILMVSIEAAVICDSCLR